MAISKKLIIKKPKKHALAPDDVIIKADLGTVYIFPGDREADRRVVDLFEAHGLDIKKGGAWLELLRVLSEGFIERKKGNPPKWTEEAFGKLLSDWFILSKQGLLKGDTYVDQAVCILKHFGSDRLYQNLSAKELGKRLGECIRRTTQARTKPR
jgi:hypothetical protein